MLNNICIAAVSLALLILSARKVYMYRKGCYKPLMLGSKSSEDWSDFLVFGVMIVYVLLPNPGALKYIVVLYSLFWVAALHTVLNLLHYKVTRERRVVAHVLVYDVLIAGFSAWLLMR